MNFERYRELFGDLLVIFYGAIFVYIFSQIILTGNVTLVEPKSWLAKIELILSGLITFLGLDRLIKDLRD